MAAADRSCAGPLVGLASGSVFPEPVDRAFALAAALGYDGVEVMVGLDRMSQDVDALADLVQHHQIPVLAIHSPCLIITQRVWGADPWGKLLRSREAARRLGAGVVVVHPPFLWQRSYTRDFLAGLDRLAGLGPLGGLAPAVDFAVENMFPIDVAGRALSTYGPGWQVHSPGSPQGGGSRYRHVTLDLSHTAASGSDALGVLEAVGPALRHLHLGDGRTRADGRPGRDEHLVPGRGDQPCEQVLRRVADSGFDGAVVVEINTRRATSAQRESDAAQSLAFARSHLRR